MNQRLKKYRAGQVSAAVWENPANGNGKQVTVLKATVERRYKDRDGNWQSGGGFGRNESPVAIYVPGKACGAIVEEQRAMHGPVQGGAGGVDNQAAS